MSKKLKAEVIFDDEDLFNWIIVVEFEGEKLPLGEEHFTYEFETKEQALEWIGRHNDKYFIS